MKYTIDKFEGNFAVLEEFDSKNFINVLKLEIPTNASEGDVLEFYNGVYTILKNDTSKKKENIKDRFERLRKK